MKVERVVLNAVSMECGPPSGRSALRRREGAPAPPSLSLECVLFNALSVCESECAD